MTDVKLLKVVIDNWFRMQLVIDINIRLKNN